jgi:hypothetical protein
MRIRHISSDGAGQALQPVRPVQRPSAQPHSPPPFHIVDRVTLSAEARAKSRQAQQQAGVREAQASATLKLTYEGPAAPPLGGAASADPSPTQDRNAGRDAEFLPDRCS